MVLSKEILYILSRRADSGPNQKNLSSIRQIRERYQKVLVSFQNDIGTFVLSFLTLLLLNQSMRDKEASEDCGEVVEAEKIPEVSIY